MPLRIRIRYRAWPRPALVLTDTPRPGCPDCRGEGGWTADYADQDGEYGGTDDVWCDCWQPNRAWLLLPLPRWWRRRKAPTYSSEAPF